MLINDLEMEVLRAPDPALSRLITLLKETKTVEELAEKTSLINRIVVDSVRNMEVGEKILIFTNAIEKSRKTWTQSQRETSNGVWTVTFTHKWGPKIEKTGTDLDRLIEECKKATPGIERQLNQ